MEKGRNIKITLEQAIELYNSDNSTLHTLALSAYSKDELDPHFKYINSKVHNTCLLISVPVDEISKYNTLAHLTTIAKFFNGSWKKTPNNAGYYLGKLNAKRGSVSDTYNGVRIYQHMYGAAHAGVVYFKNYEDAIKAVKILDEEVKNLFD